MEKNKTREEQIVEGFKNLFSLSREDLGAVLSSFSALEILFLLWRHSFRKRPKITGAATIAIVVGIALLLSHEAAEQKKREVERRRSATYDQQVKQLDITSRNLRELQEFVESQRKRLKESEDVLADLREEHQKMQPIVDADRKVVEALFVAQEQRQQYNIWWERGVAFFLGFVASLLASALWTGLLRFFVERSIKSRRAEDAPSSSAERGSDS